ncbi:Uncharacterized protein BP5553_02071 [Venustampulla echinocandica]|uniref:Secondary alcohol dehydrogenase protein n=1 Tax=Venustampulla echinocandica TaxID=2656787 RepID=A0A370U2T9_9HELO|nr:Uncharacterized protein BP5553_02071 [Venustampulla echinocandica]RDL42092.1 Uncharacterized protein BP5553_02071 [Venustampulla echinocandica]
MSSETNPISPGRFAEALKDLPLSTLHLKAAEIRNNIAHLDYSNEQLKPFAEGTETSANGVPDQDCVDAIRENEIVIARMQERLQLLRAEVEGRGSSWDEFRSAEEIRDAQREAEGRTESGERTVNGTGEGHEEEGDRDATQGGLSEAWRDGTFQTGRIVNGEVQMDEAPPGNRATNGSGNATTNGTGGRLDDETLMRAMEERMRVLAEEDEGGIHL